MAVQEYYSASELAKKAGLSRQMINHDIKEGKIRAVKFGGSYIIKKDEGDQYLRRRELEGKGLTAKKEGRSAKRINIH